jgi:putative ubiquitin-RnfH superfamily antitoxin RatB of RatAB toxin-antitoxin module
VAVADAPSVRVTVAHARPERQELVELALPAGATLADAIAASGLLARFPDLDAATLKAGIFGRVRPRETRLADGDRVEIYRPLVADPKFVRRKRAGIDPRALRDRVPRSERTRRRPGGG